MKSANLCEIIGNISEPRLETYRKVDNFEEDELLSFYFKIQEISSHFFVPIQVLEISLRNRLNTELNNLCKTRKNWKGKKWHHVIRPDLSDSSKTMLDRAKPDTCQAEGDWVARLSFGFWVYLLDKKHRNNENPYSFWQYIDEKVFPYKGKKSIKEIFDILKRVNRVRNRLYHYEPIWKETKQHKLNKNIVINKMKQEYNKIYEAIGLVSLENKNLMERLNFKEEFYKCCTWNYK